MRGTYLRGMRQGVCLTSTIWKELSGVNAHRSRPIPNRHFGGLPAVGGFWASPSADLAQAFSGHALEPSTLEMAGQTVVSISFHPRC